MISTTSIMFGWVEEVCDCGCCDIHRVTERLVCEIYLYLEFLDIAKEEAS